jgi:hypothetical protein
MHAGRGARCQVPFRRGKCAFPLAVRRLLLMEITMPEARNRITLIGPDGPVVSCRAFLRGTLLGATAASAGALSACMPMAPEVVAPAPAAATMVARGQPRNVSKAVARYQDRPNRGQRCGRCMHFLPPGGCEIVVGPVSPQGWCRYFEGSVALTAIGQNEPTGAASSCGKTEQVVHRSISPVTPACLSMQ